MKSKKINLVLGLFLILLNFSLCESRKLHDERRLHASKKLTDDEIGHIGQLSSESYFNHVLGHILIERVVGTPNHERVKKFIMDEMGSLGWDVEVDEFKANTPIFGVLPFTNIIAHNAANKTRRLVLACHYDSKYFAEFEFVAATDSAVPCAMMIHMAKLLTPHLTDTNVGLSLIFFDGEEAFLNWSPEDSLYGARSLAAKWENQPYLDEARSLTTNHLDRIDMMVLLDLIGVKNQKFYSFFRETDKWHALLSKIEKKLKKLNIIPTKQNYHFLERSTLGRIEDDHIPFLHRNVPILHVIPAEFPKEWHTQNDNYACLDFPSIDSMTRVLQVFVYAYVHGSSA